MKTIIIEDPRARIQRIEHPDDVWLLCDVCRRFFQYGNALPTSHYRRDACPFDDCHGVGLGFQLFWWDDMREPDDPRWPSSVDQLAHGMQSPDMEPFYQARLAERIAAAVSAFADSPEAVHALGDRPPRYLGPFLKMMADLCWDLTVPQEAGFSADTARELIVDLPVWSRTADLEEAPRMCEELRAFFAFASRTGAVADAASWLAVVDEPDLDDVFRYTMETDRRLRPSRGRQPCRSSRTSKRARRASTRKKRPKARRRKR